MMIKVKKRKMALLIDVIIVIRQFFHHPYTPKKHTLNFCLIFFLCLYDGFVCNFRAQIPVLSIDNALIYHIEE